MPFVTVYYQGHKVEYVPLYTNLSAKTWTVDQNGERFKVREFHGPSTGTYLYDLYSVGANGRWRIQEADIASLDGVARVICDTVYV